MSKAKQHVVPNQSGGWAVRKSGASRVSRVFGTQSDAVTYARDRARKAGSELYVHGRDGTVKERESYGSAAAPPNGRD